MNPSRSLNPTQFFMLFAACCLLPFVAAKLALSLSWFSPGVNNKGDWLEQDVQLPIANGYWQVLYVQPLTCDKSCELALFSLQQFYIGLGAKNEMVRVGIIAKVAPAQLAQYPALYWQSLTSGSLEQYEKQLILVNRQGQLLLHYAPIIHEQEGMVTAKKMRADLLRLLAFDRPSSLRTIRNGNSAQ